MEDPRTLLAQAQKLESAGSGGGGFMSFLGASKTDKLEQAVETYAKAANGFRTAGQIDESGKAFEKAAALSKQINEPNDAANYHNEAFKVYQRTKPSEAARCMREAIKHYALTNVRRAATNKQVLADMLDANGENIQRQIDTFEKRIEDAERLDSTSPDRERIVAENKGYIAQATPDCHAVKSEALAEYEQAGEWFSNDNAEALANKCFLKAADLAADLGNYPHAINRYEQIAEISVGHNLMKYSVKEYLFKAALCHIATKDYIAAARAIRGKYPNMDNAFVPPSIEGLFVNNLLECAENGDPAGFNQHVTMYQARYSIDTWKSRLLRRINAGIAEAGDDELL